MLGQVLYRIAHNKQVGMQPVGRRGILDKYFQRVLSYETPPVWIRRSYPGYQSCNSEYHCSRSTSSRRVQTICP